MRRAHPRAGATLVGVMAAALVACQQTDQKLPFEVDPAAGQSVQITNSGGIVSLPPTFSIEFFSGTLPGAEVVTARERLEAFPQDMGSVLPGTAFDVGPAGTPLSPLAPAEVQIAVPAALLGEGQELSLSVALLQPGGSIVTDATSYDMSTGTLTADVYELGPVAAVVEADAIEVGDIADVPPLDGGAITPSPPQASAPAATHPGGVVYSASCSPGERSCFTSGIAKIWADDVVRERLGDRMVLVNTTVEASLDFFAFDLSSLPTSTVGYVRIDGDLRARINEVVASREVGDEVSFHTGNDPSIPLETGVSISGAEMTFEFTSQESPQVLLFDISGVGTTDLLTIELEGDIQFENASGPPTVGRIVAHLRLRR